MKNTKWVKIRSPEIALEIRPQLSSQARALGLRMKLLGTGVICSPAVRVDENLPGVQYWEGQGGTVAAAAAAAAADPQSTKHPFIT